jgi:hypothetical protein
MRSMQRKGKSMKDDRIVGAKRKIVKEKVRDNLFLWG